MPQLDKFTFATQIFWLSFFFLSSYFITLNFFLPRILSILRLRNSKLNYYKSSISANRVEENVILKSSNLLLERQLIFCEKTLNNLFKSFNSWVEKVKGDLG